MDRLLINSKKELKDAVSFSGDLDFDTIRPALVSAQAFVARFVGEALLAEFSTTETLDDEHTALLPYLQVVVGNLALVKRLNSGNVQISDSGVMRTKSESISDAFEWQLERALQVFRQDAFDGLESLLRYLETKLNVFTAYAESAPYLADKDRLIRSAEVFTQYYNINASRLVFQTLQASMRTVEMQKIRPLLSGSLTDNQQDAARRALAYGTIARALREQLVSITDLGVMVNGISNFGTLRYQQPASDKQLQRTLDFFDGEFSAALASLNTLLQPTPTTTPIGSRVSGTKIVSF